MRFFDLLSQRGWRLSNMKSTLFSKDFHSFQKKSSISHPLALSKRSPAKMSFFRPLSRYLSSHLRRNQFLSARLSVERAPRARLHPFNALSNVRYMTTESKSKEGSDVSNPVSDEKVRREHGGSGIRHVKIIGVPSRSKTPKPIPQTQPTNPLTQPPPLL